VDNAIEVRYAGVVVGRGVLARDLGEDGAFVGIAEPLPVGTNVSLKIGDAVREGRVDEVVESADLAVVGMRVTWGGAARTAPAAKAVVPVVPALEAAKFVEPSPVAVVSSAPSTDAGSGPTGVQPVAEVEDSSSANGAIPVPMSLSGDTAQNGGKRRRKRR
jgi:hypothetical protein